MSWDFPSDSVVKTRSSQCWGPGSDPWTGTSSYMPQLKFLHAVTKTRDSQINKYILFFKGDTEIENKLVDTVNEEEGGMNKESNIETYTLPCVKQVADGRLLYDSRAQTRCSVTT